MRTCTRPGCGGRMMADRLNQGEWNCVNCGNVEYGEGFTPREYEPPNSAMRGYGRTQARGARHGGVRI